MFSNIIKIKKILLLTCIEIYLCMLYECISFCINENCFNVIEFNTTSDICSNCWKLIRNLRKYSVIVLIF